jgi:peptidoglycan/LPS O-acetylase OafA/YrhL
MSMSIGDESRAQAVNRLWARRAFRIHLIAFLMGSVVMLLVWATTSGDYFWPVWPIAGWGAGLALHAWITFGRWSFSETAIQQEIRRDK